MKITDQTTLVDFFESLAKGEPGIDHFLLLSNGEKAINEIESYFTNDYKGVTAFFQIAEAGRRNNGASQEMLTFMCSLTIAQKPADVSARAGLAARDNTMKLLLQILGKIELAADESDEEDNDYLRIEPVERIFPIGQMANVDIDGNYIDIDVTISATHLLY